MVEYLHNVSRFCGFKHALLPNVLRRGNAYILAVTTTKNERAARMGYTNKDVTYWAFYCNTISTVDFQGLRYSLPHESVATMFSVFLTQSFHRPLDRVSEKGIKNVH